jgi:hypothetical protein
MELRNPTIKKRNNVKHTKKALNRLGLVPLKGTASLTAQVRIAKIIYPIQKSKGISHYGELDLKGHPQK